MEKAMDFRELQEIVSVCLDEIIKLKQENTELKKTVETIVQAQQSLLKNLQENYGTISTNFDIQASTLENLRYELNDPEMSRADLLYPKFYSIEKSVDELVAGKSMARFGDGEFAIMSNMQRHPFQHLDQKLAERLKEVISSKEDGLLIGIADNYGSLEKYNASGKSGIRLYMTEEVRKEHWKFLDKDRIYHNAYISRPYVLYADNMTDAPRYRFENLKRIWEGKDVIFVEGALTRLGVGNDLFDNAARIRRIEAPPVSSFDKYDEILAAALQYAEQDTLFLIALGPSAGVLAYDLYHAGYQAIDIGHVDLEYEWYRNGTGGRSEVRNKYNNEWPDGYMVNNDVDEKYLREILCMIEGDE